MPRARTTRIGTTPAPPAKAPVKAKKLKTPLENVEPVSGSLRLDDVTRLTLRSLSAEGEAASSEAQVKQLTLVAFLKSIDPNGLVVKFQQEIAQLEQHRASLKAQYEDLVKATEKKLGIKLSDYSYDPESGILHKSDDEAASKPPAQPQKG